MPAIRINRSASKNLAIVLHEICKVNTMLCQPFHNNAGSNTIRISILVCPFSMRRYALKSTKQHVLDLTKQTYAQMTHGSSRLHALASKMELELER